MYFSADGSNSRFSMILLLFGMKSPREISPFGQMLGIVVAVKDKHELFTSAQ